VTQRRTRDEPTEARRGAPWAVIHTFEYLPLKVQSSRWAVLPMGTHASRKHGSAEIGGASSKAETSMRCVQSYCESRRATE
jgi:hypothetical protein